MSDNLIGATTAIFIVSLSIAVNEPVDVAWSTRDGTAKAGTDYQAANGVVSFLPGETRKQIEVIVYGQNVSPTGDKNFFINLMPPTNAVLGTTLIEAVIKVEDESGVPVTSVIVAQGKRGLKGDPGLSAYEQAVLMGYDGTLEDWMQEQADAAAAAHRASDYAANAAAAATKAENAATAASFLGNIFPTPEAGVDPVTGVGNGAYYNVRSTEDDSFLVEYQNIGGVPTPSGKSYPSSAALTDLKKVIIDQDTGKATASKVFNSKGLSVQDFSDAVAEVALIKEANTWQQNRDIIQAINDDLYLNFGGGKIQLPSGSFYLKGVLLDSGVQIYGNKTVIAHPDNYDGDIFETRMYATTGSCTKNSKTVTVTDASNFRVGSLIAIRGGGGLSRTQNTALVGSISSTDTANLQLSSTTGFLTGGLLQVGDELISYTSIGANGVLGGVVRGVLGSVAVDHAADAQIGVAMQHISEIIAISGNTVTMLDAAKTTVTETTVQAGGQGCKVVNVSYIGERQLDVSGWRWSPCRFRLHRFGEIDVYAENCENGFSLTYSSDNVVNFAGKDLAKIGGAGGAVGAGGWLFQHCHRNTVNAKIIGSTNVGIYLDNKSNYGTEWDGDCNGNNGNLTFKFDNYNLNSNLTVGLGIAAGSYNEFNVVSEGVRTPVTLTASSQTRNTDGYVPDCKGNFVNISMPHGNCALICDGGAVGNTFLINQGLYNIEPTVIDGNIILSLNSKTEIGNYLRFRNGSAAKPGISFSEDPSHGFVRTANNDIRLFRAGVERLRFVDSGLYFPSGQVLSSAGDGLRIGGSPSQKFGFFGKTPIAQPTVSAAATDAATTQALVNELRNTLILLGLIASP